MNVYLKIVLLNVIFKTIVLNYLRTDIIIFSLFTLALF